MWASPNSFNDARTTGLDSELTKLGAEGWDLVTVQPAGSGALLFVFRRAADTPDHAI